MPTPSLAPALALCLATGCATFAPHLASPDESPGSRNRAARWDGPECRRVLYELDEVNSPSMPTVADGSLAGQVLLRVCTRRQKLEYSGHTTEQQPRIAEVSASELYFGWDDSELRPLDAAALATAVVGIAANQELAAPVQIALAVFLTQVIPPELVERGLASVDVPAGARAALLALYRAVPGQLGGGLSPDELQVHVALPVAVFTARRGHFAAHRALYDRLAALHADAVAARDDDRRIVPTIAALAELRREFLTRCKTIECRYMPLYAHATSELAQLHVLRGDLLSARVESRLFSTDGSYLGGIAQAVRSAQDSLLEDMKTAWAKYKKGVASGADDRAARRLAGPALPAAEPEYMVLLEPTLALPDYSKALETSPNQYYTSNGIVDRVKGSGATRTVVFQQLGYEFDEAAYTCNRGDRLVRIRADGTLAYDHSCRWKTTTINDSRDPITVPAEEASAIKRGDVVVFMSHDSRSLVLEVRRGADTVQIRGDRLPR